MTSKAVLHERIATLMDEHGLDGWAIKWNGNLKRRLGQCQFSNETLEFSTNLTLLADDRVRNIALHEIAHALVGPGHGHDRVWQACARRIGCDGKRCQHIEEGVLPPAKYTITCQCGKVRGDRHRITRAAREGYLHASCCGETVRMNGQSHYGMSRVKIITNY